MFLMLLWLMNSSSPRNCQMTRSPWRSTLHLTVCCDFVLYLNLCSLSDGAGDALPHLLPPQFQLIRRSYPSLQHVLHGFDFAACAFAFDGKNVWARDDAKRTVSTGVIRADSCHRSFQLEDRLLKYVTRGFALEVPELDFKRIATNLDQQCKCILLFFASNGLS